jgi:DNA-binding response OmpR family regulator
MSALPESRAPVVAIIDDEEDIVTYLRVALEDEGYDVIATSESANAIELLDDTTPDLVCLDLLMPERTGISLYATLTRHTRFGKVPVLILSGLTTREGLPAILEEAGGLPEPAGFIEKPVDIDQFLDTVRRVLGRASRTPP